MRHPVFYCGQKGFCGYVSGTHESAVVLKYDFEKTLSKRGFIWKRVFNAILTTAGSSMMEMCFAHPRPYLLESPSWSSHVARHAANSVRCRQGRPPGSGSCLLLASPDRSVFTVSPESLFFSPLIQRGGFCVLIFGWSANLGKMA